MSWSIFHRPGSYVDSEFCCPERAESQQSVTQSVVSESGSIACSKQAFVCLHDRSLRFKYPSFSSQYRRGRRRQIAWQDDFDRHAMACWSAIPLNDEYFSFTALQLRFLPQRQMISRNVQSELCSDTLLTVKASSKT